MVEAKIDGETFAEVDCSKISCKILEGLQTKLLKYKELESKFNNVTNEFNKQAELIKKRDVKGQNNWVTKFNDADHKLQIMTINKEDLDIEVKNLREANKKLHDDLISKEREYDEIQTRAELDEEINKRNRSLKKLKEEVMKKEVEFKKLNKLNEKIRDRMEDDTMEINVIREEYNKKLKSLKQYNLQLARLKKDIKKLELKKRLKDTTPFSFKDFFKKKVKKEIKT